MPNNPTGGAPSQSATPHSSADAARLFDEFANTRDLALREQLIVLHLSLVTRLARRLAPRSEDLDDLVQVGYIGLMKAIDRFEPERGYKFGTYAEPTIDGEMRRYLRDKASMIRMPARLQELRCAATRSRDRLIQSLGRPPSVEEIAADLRVEPQQVAAAWGEQFATPVSLDHTDDDPEVLSVASVADERLRAFEERSLLGTAFEGLTPRQRAILYLLFYEDLSQAAIGERLSISQMHVSRLARAALDRLREGLEQQDSD